MEAYTATRASATDFGARLARDAPPGPCALVVALLYVAAMFLGVALM